jgi:cysteine desulfuration protein SufE
VDVAPELPEPLAAMVGEFRMMDRGERTESLIDLADRFVEVPPDVATRPFPETQRAPRCESEAFVWAVDQPDGTVRFHFAVENPQGVSARAWAAILGETLSGQPLERVALVPPEVVYEIFGRDLSMGKGQGLLGMLELVHYEARRRLNARRAQTQGPIPSA